ncbi:MAG TPA: hydrogenase iron-sulfur subunit [Candidatus Bathyarchaeia archaeon]
MSVQVLFCTCGDVLKERLDFDELKAFVRGLEGVTEILTTEAACTKAVKEELVEAMTGGGDKVVAFACTRSVCGKPLEAVMEGSGLDPQSLVILNSKEQIAWVHPDRDEATGKAKRLMAAAVAKARSVRPMDTVKYQRHQTALVVGAGVAGLTAASELADQGYTVHVVERKPAIGGVMPLISKTYPEEDCTKCLRGPRMIELLTKPGVTYHVSSEVKAVERTLKGFKVTVERRPVELDVEPKAGKGQPVEAMQTKSGKPVYKLVYRGEPSKAAVKAVAESRCGRCTSVFPAALMGLDEEPGEQTLEVGAVVIATGFQDFDATGIPKWGYGLPNVITQYQLARLMDPLGPTGGVVARPSDLKQPHSIVMVQCVGSRDPEYYADCSKYCCMAAIKHSTIIKKFKEPEAEVTVLFRDIRASGYGFETLYNEAKALGVKFVHGDILSVETSGDGLSVDYVNGMSEPGHLEADMLVLSTGMTPAEGSDGVAELFNVELADSGFMKEVDEKVANITTRAPGVFIAGACTGPKNISDSIAQAGAAAYMAGSHLGTHLEKLSDHPIVDEENCGKCGICRSVCPYDAITIPEDGYPQFDPELCQSCGLCVSSCPTRALETPNYGFDLIDAQVEAITAEKEGPLIVGFLCDDCGYNLLDTAGFTKATYTASFVPVYVNCMSNLSLRNVLNAVKMGADGVMLVGCVKDRCHFLKGTQRSKSQMDIIGEFFQAVGIETPIAILESSGTMVAQFTEALARMAEQLEEARR